MYIFFKIRSARKIFNSCESEGLLFKMYTNFKFHNIHNKGMGQYRSIQYFYRISYDFIAHNCYIYQQTFFKYYFF